MFDEWANENKYNLLAVTPLTIFSLVWKGAFRLISGVSDVSWWLQAPEDSLEPVPDVSTTDNNVSRMSLFVLKFLAPFIKCDKCWLSMCGKWCNTQLLAQPTVTKFLIFTG